MSISVKLVLPDNLQSTYLQANFIDYGAVYTTSNSSSISARNTNQHDLVFGFQLVDEQTRGSVPFGQIRSLKLTNDPNFDTPSIIEIDNWPASGYNTSTDYVCTLNPQYLIDGTGSMASYTTQAGQGNFIVKNWALSANGGLSAVYMMAVVADVSGNTSSYPGGYGLFDQIFWQADPPSIPGKPWPECKNPSYTGRDTLWRFRASEEPSSGLYSTGVSRYVADVIELRLDPYGNILLSSSNGSAITGNSRTLAPETAASATLTTVGYNYASGPRTYSTDSGSNRVIGSPIPLNLSGSRGAVLASNTPTTLSQVAPDFVVQASVVITPLAIDSACHLEIKACDSATPGNGTEISVHVVVPENGLPTATLYTAINNVVQSGSQTTTLPFYAEEDLIAGGVLELYIQNVVSPSGDDISYATAYFTPNSRPNESMLLASALFNAFTRPINTLYSQVVGYTAVGDGTLLVNEIVQGAGRFLLGVDMGDCSSDDINTSGFPIVSVSSTASGWTNATADHTFVKIIEVFGSPFAPPSATVSYNIDTEYLQLTALPTSLYRETVELESVMPTFSNRILVDWSMVHTDGEFYIGMSSVPALSTDRPIGTRCDTDFDLTNEPIYAPTIVVSFSALNRCISLAIRRPDTTLTVKNLCPYDPAASSALETWSVQIVEGAPESLADGTYLIIKRNLEVVGIESLDAMITSANQGLGWYVAFGSRSYKTAYDSGISDGSTQIFDFSIKSLPPIATAIQTDGATVRHFHKGNGASIYSKPWLGQGMLSAATDKGPFLFKTINGVTLLDNVVAATTGENIDINGSIFPSSIDGHSLTNGDHVLLKDQIDPTQNGIWLVHSPVWSLTLAFDHVGADWQGGYVYVVNGTINANTFWVLPDQYNPYDPTNSTVPSLTGTDSWYFKSTTFLYKMNIGSFNTGTLVTSVHPQLFEVKIRSINKSNSTFVPQVRFYADNAGSPDAPLTSWINTTSARSTRPPVIIAGSDVPNNDLVQFVLTDSGLSITPNSTIWVAVQVPFGCELASANAGDDLFPEVFGSTSPFCGWGLAGTIWHKLFTSALQRHDNAQNGALLQTRILADSHARFASQPSALSHPITVDIIAPGDSGSNRPTLALTEQAVIKSAQITVTAEDSNSGVLAFRIVHEADNGVIVFSPWQPWSQFNTTSSSVAYTVYLHGTWPLTTFGEINSQLSNLNLGSDGPRRVWAQTMDGVGNISESYPVTLLAQNSALVDTTLPTGSLQFVSGNDGTSISLTNNTSSWLSIQGYDRVSSVKDLRTRPLYAGMAGSWSNWSPISDYQPTVLNSSQDGIRRIEAQFRDYGNNSLQNTMLWDTLIYSSSNGLLFVNMAVWTIPGSNTDCLYLAAIKSEVFTDFNLIDAGNSSYPANTAFYALSSAGRQITFRSTDRVTTSSETSFTINASNGLLIFDSAQSDPATATIKRDSAQIYSWDGNAILKVVDLGNLGEKAILSMCATSKYLFIGCGSGNIYAFDGRLLKGPIFTCSDSGNPLPVTTLISHQFRHEKQLVLNTTTELISETGNNVYLYAGTSITPRLFRAPLITAIKGGSWQRVGITGFLNTSTGNVTCSTSGYDNLFLGTNQSMVLRYQRRIVNGIENEYLIESPLINSRINETDGTNMPVSSLLTSGSQIFAGITDRPEIWSYAEIYQDSPSIKEAWATQILDNNFVNDPVFWQFYSSNGITNTRANTLLDIQQITDPYTARGFRYIMILTGNSGNFTTFTADNGSDWEAVISKNAPTITHTNVSYATTSNVTLSGLSNVIDGVTVNTAGVRILVKNQTVATQNGIYVTASGYWSRSGDMVTGYNYSVNERVFVNGGNTQSRTNWLTSASGIIDTSGLQWVQPSYTFEADMMNLSGTGAQGFQISDGYWFLDVSVGISSLRITSGNNTIAKTYKGNIVTAFSDTNDLVYPEAGVQKDWNFSNSVQEDRGPYWTGGGGTGSVQGWTASRFVSSIVLASESDHDATFTTTSNYIQPIIESSGDPRIVNESIAPGIQVNSQSRMLVKLRMSHNSTNAELRVSWSDQVGQYVDWTSVPLFNDENYHTYELKPAWYGVINAIAIEIGGLTEGLERPNIFDIDYIAITSDIIEPNIVDNLTPVRVGVDGTRVQVWVGKDENPLLDETNFLTLPTTSTQIRFGKTNASEATSTWGWGNIRFLAGQVYKPVTRQIFDFAIQSRLPSTGGVQCLINNQGTAHALTDGVYIVRKTDNPDDRASKAFRYDPNFQIWEWENPPYPRNNDGTGVIRPLAAANFRGTLVVTGQKGTIRSPY